MDLAKNCCLLESFGSPLHHLWGKCSRVPAQVSVAEMIYWGIERHWKSLICKYSVNVGGKLEAVEFRWFSGSNHHLRATNEHGCGLQMRVVSGTWHWKFWKIHMFHRKTVVTLMTLMDISGRFPLRWPDLDPPTNQLKSGPLQWNRSHCPPSWTSQHRLDVHPAHLRGYADAVWLASRCWYLKIPCQKKIVS